MRNAPRKNAPFGNRYAACGFRRGLLGHKEYFDMPTQMIEAIGRHRRILLRLGEDGSSLGVPRRMSASPKRRDNLAFLNSRHQQCDSSGSANRQCHYRCFDTECSAG